jgi:signal transduction histidine kinase/DNA-binding response OmpR family regulator
MAGFIGWVVALAAGVALGWIWQRAHRRGPGSDASTSPAAQAKADELTLDRLPMPALAYDHDGQWHASNAASAKFFADRELSATQAVPTGLAARIRDCAKTHRHAVLEHKCGSVWIGWLLSPLDEHYVLALLTDITEQKTRELTLTTERDTAARAARMTSEFIAMLSHDIRVPMNGVLGMANLLLEAELNPQQLELARSVVDSAESVITLTDELLDLAKIEAGKLEITPQPVELSSLLGEMLRGQAARAAEKHLDLAFEVDPALPAMIYADPLRLRQILANLLSNALKFTDRGEVYCRVWCEPSTQNPAAREMRFSVRDTGIGIPQEKRDRIFQAYTQADSSTYSLYGGTGLGLATSRRLAELMGGRLWFESEAGQGSTFLLALPYQPVENSAPPQWTQRHVQVDGREILLVEDNPRLAELMRSWVTGWGGKPKLLQNASEVLAWTEAGNRCAVALVDFDLPHAQGLAILRSLSQLHPAPRPIVFASRPPEAKAGIEQTDILLKPLAPETLLECLCRAPRPHPAKPIPQGQPAHAVPVAPAAHAASAPAVHAAASPAAPTTVASAPASNLAASKPASPPRARVVVADDDMVNQKVMRTYLERLGCEVRLASHGLEALTLIASGPCDVLFLDIMMPRMDGIQTVREIRRVEGERQAAGQTVRRLPVVAITAKVMPGDREAGLAAGFDDYATKPVNDARLRESLQKFIPSFQPPGPLTTGTSQLATQQAVLLDRSRLDELSSGDPDTLREIVLLFFERMEELFPDIDRTLAAGDLVEARRHAHTGAGSCATCGMMQAQNVMRRMERSIEAGELAHTRDLIHEARRVLAATRTAAHALLPGLK